MTEVLITAFKEIFEQLGFREKSLNSAAYYVLLIQNFPTKFSTCLKEFKDILDASTSSFLKSYKADTTDTRLTSNFIEGRNELLDKGIIAAIHRADVPASTDFGREMYLPVYPKLIWEEYQERVKLESIMEKDEIDKRENRIKELSESYKKFGKFGFGMTEGNITIIYTSHWLLLTLINNLNNITKLNLMISGLESFELPFRRYYEKMLGHGLSMRVLFDPAKIEDARIRQNILKVRDFSPRNFDIRTTPVKYVNSRRVISDAFAIDGAKLLKNTEDEEKNPDKPSYYSGTIYLNRIPIERLESNFDSAWEKGKIIELY